MKKYETIKTHQEFSEIIATSKCIKNKYYNIYIRKRDILYSRFGLAISKKVGNAVTRNKLKRRVRMIIHNNKHIFKNDSDYIIMIKKECNNILYEELEMQLLKLIKEIK